MTPGQLREYLDVLRACDVTRGGVEVEDGPTGPGFKINVEFAPKPVPIGLVDESGAAIDLDEGMPDLARDDYDPQALERSNLAPKK